MGASSQFPFYRIGAKNDQKSRNPEKRLNCTLLTFLREYNEDPIRKKLCIYWDFGPKCPKKSLICTLLTFFDDNRPEIAKLHATDVF